MVKGVRYAMPGYLNGPLIIMCAKTTTRLTLFHTHDNGQSFGLTTLRYYSLTTSPQLTQTVVTIDPLHGRCLRKVAKLVLQKPERHSHLIAVNSEHLDCRELQKEGQVYDTHEDPDKHDVDFYNIPHEFTSRHRQHLNSITDLEGNHL